MSEDYVLFGYRLRVLEHAGRTSVSEACRVFGIHRSTFYVWKRRVERHGLEVLRPRERRRPRMPRQLSPFLEERIVAFALGHPGYGPKRIASELGREKWGGIVVSHNGVWRCLRRHGLNTRLKRLSLVASYRAPYEPPRQPQPERHVEAERPGELVGIDCFFVGRLAGTKGSVWQLTAIDVASSFAGPSSSAARTATRPERRPRSSRAASRPSCGRRVGGSSACSPTDESQPWTGLGSGGRVVVGAGDPGPKSRARRWDPCRAGFAVLTASVSLSVGGVRALGLLASPVADGSLVGALGLLADCSFCCSLRRA